MKKSILKGLLVAVFFGVLSTTAFAQTTCSLNYGLGNDVSVKYCNTHKKEWGTNEYIWYWVFTNKGSTKITEMEFEIERTKENYTTEKTTEFLPVPIEGGKSFGGWAAFSVSSIKEPSIKIISIKRK